MRKILLLNVTELLKFDLDCGEKFSAIVALNAVPQNVLICFIF